MRDNGAVLDYPPPRHPVRALPVVPRDEPGGPTDTRSPRSRPGRRARRRSIRIRVAALAVTMFIAAWAVIGVQMATGHDPALAASTKRDTVAVEQTATTSAKSAAAKRASAASTTNGDTTGSSSTSSGSTSSGGSSSPTSGSTSSSGSTPVSTHSS
jgi:uncharacterized membrane protein YgcG